ncbi:MAG: DUF3575 domain-containing protein [Flavobacterium sp.]|nr:DUF3575 domain-containing protein [Flavobacterium sp.]
MKKFILLGLVLISFLSTAQEAEKVSVEKNLNSVQLGLFSLSYQNEIRLDRKFTLRSEAGLSTGKSTMKYPDGHSESSFLIVPYINIEPRWYYSLDRRNRLEKNNTNNSSNYFSLLTTYVFTQATLVNSKNYNANPLIQIIPEYGFRRSFRKNFFWDASVGVGYRHNFSDKLYQSTVDENETVIDIQYKLGYIF